MSKYAAWLAPFGVNFMADYQINTGAIKSQDRCACGHPAAAHGSRGMKCCACNCDLFQGKEEEDTPDGKS